MTDDDIRPTRKDAREKTIGRSLVAQGLTQIITLAVLGLMFWIYNAQKDVIDTLAGQLTAQQQQFDDCKSKPANAPGCTEKVSEPATKIVKEKIPAIVGKPGKPGPPGKDAPQAADVRAMIVTELARSRPQLTTPQVQQIARVASSLVPKPADGKTPTPAQLRPVVDTAVMVYCGQSRCDGPAGKDGQKGADGQTPTDAELKALISDTLIAYCAQDSAPCRGKNGLSVRAAVEPVDNGTRVTLTYSDGTAAGAFTVLDGVRGPAGKDGADGKDGQDGPAGPPGPDESLNRCDAAGGALRSLTVQTGPLNTATILVCVISQ